MFVRALGRSFLIVIMLWCFVEVSSRPGFGSRIPFCTTPPSGSHCRLRCCSPNSRPTSTNYYMLSGGSTNANTVCANTPVPFQFMQTDWVVQPSSKIALVNGEFRIRGSAINYFHIWHIRRNCRGERLRGRKCDQLLVKNRLIPMFGEGWFDYWNRDHSGIPPWIQRHPAPLPHAAFNITYYPHQSSARPITGIFEIGARNSIYFTSSTAPLLDFRLGNLLFFEYRNFRDRLPYLRACEINEDGSVKGSDLFYISRMRKDPSCIPYEPPAGRIPSAKHLGYLGVSPPVKDFLRTGPKRVFVSSGLCTSAEYVRSENITINVKDDVGPPLNLDRRIPIDIGK